MSAGWMVRTLGLMVAGLLIGHCLGYAYDVAIGSPIDTDFDAGFWAALMLARSWRTIPPPRGAA